MTPTRKIIEIRPDLWYTEPGDSMYNQEIKERFLKNATGNIRNLSEGFRKLEEYERSLGKDLAEMNVIEAKNAMECGRYDEFVTIRSTISALRGYTRWCKDEEVFPNVPGGFEKLNASDVDFSSALSVTMFKDELDLLRALRTVRVFDEGYPEPVVSCLSWLGLKINEILSLEDSHISLDDRVIYAQNGSILVPGFSDNIYNVLSQYAKCKVSFRENRMGSYQVIKDQSVNTFLKKYYPRNSAKFGKGFTANQIGTAFNELNNVYFELGNYPRIKFDNIWRSGRYNRMYQSELSGVNIIAKENRAVVEEVFRQSKSYYDIIPMYKAYKKAFDLT